MAAGPDNSEGCRGMRRLTAGEKKHRLTISNGGKAYADRGDHDHDQYTRGRGNAGGVGGGGDAGSGGGWSPATAGGLRGGGGAGLEGAARACAASQGAPSGHAHALWLDPSGAAAGGGSGEGVLLV